MGGHEKVEDADELVEEVEHLVDGVEKRGVSNIAEYFDRRDQLRKKSKE